jgi:hypothetical protein
MLIGLLTGVVAAGCLLLAPAGASAATFNCDAAALQLSLFGGSPLMLGTANLNQPICVNANDIVVNVPQNLGLPLTASALNATTALSDAGQTANSAAGLLGLNVGIGGSVLSQITGPVVQQLTGSAQPISLNQGIVGTLLQSLGLGSQSITSAQQLSAVQQLLDSVLANALNGSIAGVNVAQSQAQSVCVNGQPQLAGSSQLAGLSVLGQNVPLDPVLNQVLPLLNTQQLSQINLSSTINGLLAGLEQSMNLGQLAANPLLAPLVSQLESGLASLLNSTVQPALTQLLTAAQPLINQIVTITVEPDKQTIQNGQLTQQALHLGVAIAGQSILDVVLGQARVSDKSVTCVSPAAAASLQCTKRKLTLIDVLQHGNHTFIEGAADSSLIGHRIPIYFSYTHQRVATATVLPSGFFYATAPLPPAKVRETNLARYYAQAGGETTLHLKFRRRMVTYTLSMSKNKVHITGRVLPPLANPVQTILIQRRVSCTTLITVKTIKPDARGGWSVTLPAPPTRQAGVYRAQTMVRKNTRNPKLFPTFTLPRYLAL